MPTVEILLASTAISIEKGSVRRMGIEVKKNGAQGTPFLSSY